MEVQRENGLVEPSGDDSEEATLTPWSCWSAPRALNIFVLEEVPMRQCDDSTKNNKGMLAMVRVGSTLEGTSKKLCLMHHRLVKRETGYIRGVIRRVVIDGGG